MDYIKIRRQLLEKSYYCRDSEKVHLWLHLLLKANWRPREEVLGGKPILCMPGQFTTGRKQLSRETGISESKIERILTYFEKIEQQIEQQKTSVNRLISILNWDTYQQSEQQSEQRVNNDRTTSEQRVNNEWTHYKNIKNIKKGKNIKNKENILYKNIPLSEIKFSDDSPFKKIHFDIAVGFQNLIRKNLTDLGAKTNNIDQTKGAAIDTIRLIMESDGYTEQDCRSVYKFLQQDPFWKKNILSIKTLREKFSKLIIQANGEQQNGAVQTANSANRKNTGRITAEDKKRSVERLGDMAETILQNLAPCNIQ